MSMPLTGSVALVTGASRGLGAAVAIELARLGAHCVLTARTQGGLEETDDAIRAIGGSATLVPLDLAAAKDEFDYIGPSIVERFGRLDVFVHAAAALPRLTPISHVLPRDWEASMAVNLTALYRLIRSVEPPLRAAPAGRAVVVTDAVARLPASYWGLYSVAKAGAAHMTQVWAKEVAQSPLKVNLAEPPPMGTRTRRVAFPGEDQAKLPTPAQIAPALAALCLPAETRSGETIALAP